MNKHTTHQDIDDGQDAGFGSTELALLALAVMVVLAYFYF